MMTVHDDGQKHQWGLATPEQTTATLNHATHHSKVVDGPYVDKTVAHSQYEPRAGNCFVVVIIVDVLIDFAGKSGGEGCERE